MTPARHSSSAPGKHSMRRPFRILDGVVFFVNFASALALARHLAHGLRLNGLFPSPFSLTDPPAILVSVLYWAYAALLISSPFLLALTLSLCASWMIAPRPPFSRLRRLRGARPMFAAMRGLVAVLGILVLLVLAQEVRLLPDIASGMLANYAFPSTYAVLCTCMGVVVFLSLSTARRDPRVHSAPHWRDYLGRWTARGWVVAALVGISVPMWFLPIVMVAVLFGMTRAGEPNPYPQESRGA